jgi:D-serine deaminase-like pyridoxal phosphate-dependent protein
MLGFCLASLPPSGFKLELVKGPQRVDLNPGDILFFRPDQSEALFLPFGDIAAYEGTDIVERWPTLPVIT